MTLTVDHAEHPIGAQAGTRAFREGSRGVLARPNLNLFLLGAVCVSLVGSLILDGQSAAARAGAWLDRSETRPSLDALLDDARTYPCAELFFEIGRRYEQLKNYRQAMAYLRMAEEAESASDL